MKGFWNMLRHYVAPYKHYLFGSVLLNVLSVIFNVFSFSMIMPILNMLFGLDDTDYSFIPWDSVHSSQDLINNLYYYVAEFTGSYGASRTLLFLCLFLLFHPFNELIKRHSSGIKICHCIIYCKI